MSQDTFLDSALILVGHGSTRNAESSAPTYQHAAELRRRGLFAQVVEAFWKQAPAISTALHSVTAPRVFIVPVFISEGYFTEEVIPRELGLREAGKKDFPRVQQRGSQTFYYCSPVGTHDSMTDGLLARAREVVANHPDTDRIPAPANITLFIAGHGTSQNENSRQAIERQAELIRERKIYAAVHAVFMEEQPRIADCYELAQTKNIVMVPFFISDGLHVREDIPVLLGEPLEAVQESLGRGEPTWRNPTQRKGKVIWFTPAVGTEPHIADVILERVREMAGRSVE
jgi:sirohydrochlorin cobaltochelatase